MEGKGEDAFVVLEELVELSERTRGRLGEGRQGEGRQVEI